jgi:hypothetical protein
MGIPTSEVGYTSATTRRETTKSITDMWWYLGGGEEINIMYLMQPKIVTAVNDK